MAKLLLIISFLAILLASRGILAIDYTFTNTTVSRKFDKEIGKNYTLQIMNESTTFIWKTFNQTSPADRKSVQNVSLFIDVMKGVAYTIDNQIHFSAGYIQNYSGNVSNEFTGILYHEMTHVWQYDGKGRAPSGLIEGIADFVRLKANLAPKHWVKPGDGDKWNQGYDVTAYFLDYCNDQKKGFVAELNKMMKDGFSKKYFQALLGKTVNELWKEYKTIYNPKK
ncbi:Plant basic secretory protein (BSP) family protein [Striga hermonthica]|uniref:Plant basic secretory protein (BSP) family protein n=1 Tax=Striga hermonthica TaxID=68872 RepID=A0A9N7RE60_STRHE|nr:Plant basic secretory protein (BSP) family protein [Striga hermonthica]